MGRKRGFVMTIFLIIVAAVFMYVRYVQGSVQITRTAVFKDDIDVPYILCKHERVTGFDWRIVDGNANNGTDIYCNINGADPFSELNLKYDFRIAGNTYVFYVTNRTEYYDKDLKETAVEYTVSGWDILYPVRHGTIFGLLMSHKYIVESDLVKESKSPKE